MIALPHMICGRRAARIAQCVGSTRILLTPKRRNTRNKWSLLVLRLKSTTQWKLVAHDLCAVRKQSRPCLTATLGAENLPWSGVNNEMKPWTAPIGAGPPVAAALNSSCVPRPHQKRLYHGKKLGLVAQHREPLRLCLGAHLPRAYGEEAVERDRLVD